MNRFNPVYVWIQIISSKCRPIIHEKMIKIFIIFIIIINLVGAYYYDNHHHNNDLLLFDFSLLSFWLPSLVSEKWNYFSCRILFLLQYVFYVPI